MEMLSLRCRIASPGEARPQRAYAPGLIYEMNRDQCLFIAGDDRICCGKKVVRGRYCEVHAQRCYTGRFGDKIKTPLANVNPKG